MKKAVLYRRVSSQRQSDEGKSLEDQDSELIDYCRAMRFEVIGNFEDVVSGRREKTDKRKGLAQAIEMVCAEKATLVVYDLDRLARSQSVGMRIVEQVRDCGGEIVVKSLGVDTNTPAGEMIVGIMFAVAQWGSRAIGEGVRRANRATVKEKGYRTQGEQPFGWKIQDGKRVRVPEEQAALKRMKELHKRNWSYGLIVETLNAEGHKPRHAKTWTRGSVHRLLNQRKR